MRQTVTLIFSNLQFLWAFVQAIHLNSLEINTGARSLTCDCRGVDIEVALGKFGAKFLQSV